MGRNLFLPKKQVGCLKLPKEHLLTGLTVKNSDQLEQKETTEDFIYPMLLNCQQLSQQQENVSVTVESVHRDKKKTLIVKNSTLEIDTLTTKSLEILDQGLTSREKGLIPYWNTQSKDLSKRLSLPTKTDYVDSVLLSSKRSLNKHPMGESWFSITKKIPQNKNSLTTSFPSLPVSRLEHMDSEVIKLNQLSKEQLKLKTMKFRLFPTDQEKLQLKLYFEQWKWYYNYGLDAFKHENIKINELRDEMRSYSYVYTKVGESDGKDIVFQELVKNENQDQYYCPEWWEKVHSRVIRGAFFSLKSNFYSCKHKNLKFKTKKDNDTLVFEDYNFPTVLKKIKGYYGYRTNDRKRLKIGPIQVANEAGKRGCNFIYEKDTDRYFLCYPVPVEYYPSDDRRIENQNMNSKEGYISLDPGVRKFIVGYGSDGISVIGKGANTILTSLFLELDKESDLTKRRCLWTKIKNKRNDLHWKSVKYLTDNYKDIIFGDICTSSIVRNNTLPKIIKRILLQYSFFSFKQKLIWKGNLKDCNVISVNEAYTSKICCNCGTINNVGSKEVYNCICGLEIDRDYNGAINILLKTHTLLSD
jgi:IS605 OrfB family transposase